MDHYAADAAAVVAHLDRATPSIGHSTGGSGDTHYRAHGKAVAVLISAVPPYL
jgi:non-heme chloroperoxidase